jgi:tRNA pseudouridine synthase 9
MSATASSSSGVARVNNPPLNPPSSAERRLLTAQAAAEDPSLTDTQRRKARNTAAKLQRNLNSNVHARERRKANKRKRAEVKLSSSLAGKSDVETFYFDGQRHVRPYYFEFETFAKQRWYGLTLIQLFTAEFLQESEQYYRAAIPSGRITINGAVVTCDYVIKGGDKLRHRMHRHEPPCCLPSDASIGVAFEDDEVLGENELQLI